MTLHAVKQNIIEYGKKFADIGFSLGDSPRILVQQNLRVFGTEPGADFANLQVKEIRDITGTSDPAKGALIASPYEAMVAAKTKYTAMCIQDGLSIPAVLDDMAMIIGNRVSIVPEDRLSLAKALRKSPAVLTTEGNLIVCGRNLYEVFTGLLILEKNAGIFVDADFLGGARPVCPLMGKLEHKIYLKKYSRKEMERQNRLEQQAPAEIPEEILQDAAADYAEMDLPERDWSPEEQKCREQVVEYGIRLLDSGLVQGTWGNLSLRLDDELPGSGRALVVHQKIHRPAAFHVDEFGVLPADVHDGAIPPNHLVSASAVARNLRNHLVRVVHGNPPVAGGHNPAILHAAQLFRQPVQNNPGRNLAVPAGGHHLEFRFPVLPENADF